MTTYTVEFIVEYIDWIIAIVFGGVLFFLIKNGIALTMDKNRFEDALNIRNFSFVGDKNNKIVKIKEDGEEAVNPVALVQYQKDFSNHLSTYNVLSQIISVFPLFGILGTVAALMKQLNAADAEEALAFMQNMTNNMGTALSSTFIAILLGLLLKFIASIFLLKQIGVIESMIENHEKILKLVMEQASMFKE